jgi:hypothetical protein
VFGWTLRDKKSAEARLNLLGGEPDFERRIDAEAP